MHEMAITESILSIVLDAAGESQAKKVKQVNLKIGGLTNVVPDCVEFYFAIMTKGTIAEGAGLSIEEVPVKAKCLTCSREFEPDDLVFFCPDCGDAAELVSGRELAVTSIDID